MDERNLAHEEAYDQMEEENDRERERSAPGIVLPIGQFHAEVAPWESDPSDPHGMKGVPGTGFETPWPDEDNPGAVCTLNELLRAIDNDPKVPGILLNGKPLRESDSDRFTLDGRTLAHQDSENPDALTDEEITTEDFWSKVNACIQQLCMMMVDARVCTQEFVDHFTNANFARCDAKRKKMMFICKDGHHLFVRLVDESRFSFEARGDTLQIGYFTGVSSTGLDPKEFYAVASAFLLEREIAESVNFPDDDLG